MTEHIQHYDDDTIDLIDLIRILVRRKWLIMAITTLFIAGALAFIFVTPEKYESRSVVQIGQYSLGEFIEAPAEVISWLSLRYNLDDNRRKAFPPYIEEIQQYRKSNYVEIIAQGFEPIAVQQLAKEAAEQVIAEHKTLSVFSIQSRQEQIGVIQQQLSDLINQRKQFDDILQSGKINDPLLMTSMVQQRSNLESRIQSLQNQLFSEKLDLERLKQAATQFRFFPEVPERPVWPPKLLLLVVAIVAGGMLGTLLALITEFFQRNWQSPTS